MFDGPRYFLKLNDEPEREVNRARFLQAERNAGFMPKAALRKPRKPEPLATGGFSATTPEGKVRGRIESPRRSDR